MVAGFLASVSKSAALGALLVLLALGLGPADDSWQPVIAVVAAVPMTIRSDGARVPGLGLQVRGTRRVARAPRPRAGPRRRLLAARHCRGGRRDDDDQI